MYTIISDSDTLHSKVIKTINQIVKDIRTNELPDSLRNDWVPRSIKTIRFSFIIKVVVSGLRQFMTTESSLKTMKNAFYFILKALFI